jgi:hypothetical protein
MLKRVSAVMKATLSSSGIIEYMSSAVKWG